VSLVLLHGISALAAMPVRVSGGREIPVQVTSMGVWPLRNNSAALLRISLVR